MKLGTNEDFKSYGQFTIFNSSINFRNSPVNYLKTNNPNPHGKQSSAGMVNLEEARAGTRLPRL